MQVGDVVIPQRDKRTGREVFQLASGSSYYRHAIVVSIDPFVLVSQHGDMLWSATVRSEDFQAICQVHPDIMDRCVKRYAHFLLNET